MSSHRPTWTPATGASQAPTMQYSSKDLNSHTKLKLRKNLEQNTECLNRARAEIKQIDSNKGQEQEEVNDEDFVFSKAKSEAEEAENGKGVLDTAADEEDDEEEEEDDTEALLRELEKIKKEREFERLRKEREEQEAKAKGALHNNPLLFSDANGGGSFTVKRRWDDDVVFKNQAKGVEEKPKKRFINDTLRSDFHRKFLDRYIK